MTTAAQTDYVARERAYAETHQLPPPLPRTRFYFDAGTPQFDYFATPPRVGAPLKFALRIPMVNTVTGTPAVMVELLDTQIALMQEILK